MIVYSLIRHIHCDMFRPVVVAIIVWCYSYIKAEELR